MSNYTEKIERLSEMENVLIHYTTPNNALLSISNGLSPLNNLSAQGTFPEYNGYHNGEMSLCPDKISFFKIANPVRKGLTSLEEKTTLIVDEKYLPFTEDFVTPRGFKHPAYAGEIPPEDILGILVEQDHMAPHSGLLDRTLEITNNYFARKFGKSSFKCPDYKPVKVSEYLNKQLRDPGKTTPIYVYDNKSNERPIPVKLYN